MSKCLLTKANKLFGDLSEYQGNNNPSVASPERTEEAKRDDSNEPLPRHRKLPTSVGELYFAPPNSEVVSPLADYREISFWSVSAASVIIVPSLSPSSIRSWKPAIDRAVAVATVYAGISLKIVDTAKRDCARERRLFVYDTRKSAVVAV